MNDRRLSRGTLPRLLLVCLLAAWATPATGVDQARAPATAPPRVSGQVHPGLRHPLDAIGVLSPGDAPRAPRTGGLLEDALRAAIAARGMTHRALGAATGAGGKQIPGHLLDDNQLAQAGRAAEVDLAIAARVTLLDVETDWLPGLTVWKPGLLIDLPAGAVVRTNLAFELRAVSSTTGKLLCSLHTRYGPGDRLPQQALDEAAVAALDRCFDGSP